MRCGRHCPRGATRLVDGLATKQFHYVLAVAKPCKLRSLGQEVLVGLGQLQLHWLARALPSRVCHADSEAGTSDKRLEAARRVVQATSGSAR